MWYNNLAAQKYGKYIIFSQEIVPQVRFLKARLMLPKAQGLEPCCTLRLGVLF
ncbi:hypothetical protein HanPI659440_Chr01g0027391 [Helianthus annuus]|nr:hypothetical protein HanPI659440_Chr01g0027391 [Helianthus annuus]